MQSALAQMVVGVAEGALRLVQLRNVLQCACTEISNQDSHSADRWVCWWQQLGFAMRLHSEVILPVQGPGLSAVTQVEMYMAVHHPGQL